MPRKPVLDSLLNTLVLLQQFINAESSEEEEEQDDVDIIEQWDVIVDQLDSKIGMYCAIWIAMHEVNMQTVIMFQKILSRIQPTLIMKDWRVLWNIIILLRRRMNIDVDRYLDIIQSLTPMNFMDRNFEQETNKLESLVVRMTELK